MNQEFSFYNQNASSDLRWDSGQLRVQHMWRGLYRSINACNTAISGIEDMDSELITEEQRNLLVAESRFMRAHGYYYLLRLWGGVPLHSEPTGNPEAAIQPRSSVQTIFEFIEADLKFAQQHLPVNWKGGFPDSGRCTKGSATATLAQLYATVSGAQFEGNDAPSDGDANFNNISQKYWSQARAELASLIDEGNPAQAKAPYMYALEPNLADLYAGGQQVGSAWSPVRSAKDLGQEVIWAANYEPSIYQGTWQLNHWAGRFISPYIQERFVQNGYRSVVKHDSVHRADLGRLVCKHMKRNWAGNNNENNIYWARYGGILLLMAYVENEGNGGPTQLAQDCLNAVRARARNGDGVTTYTVP
ncbi:MAG: RagB/SusD family nutrient uptake outer membrane protein [Desulfofustis sp.]|nr:RagB/SusD family nutrient uptake outer membrane protein [Desulfofustis sp.]